MNRELFLLTITMLGWRKVDQLTYTKNKIFVLIDKPYLQIQIKDKFISVPKYQDLLNWINKHDT